MKYNTIEEKSDYNSEDGSHLHADSGECQCGQCKKGKSLTIPFPDIDDIVEALNDWD